MRYQLGQVLPIFVQCIDDTGKPAFPDNAPQLKVWSDSGLVLSDVMPCEDRFIQTGVFLYQLFLGATFSAGQYTWAVYYKAGDNHGIATGAFAVMGGGNPDGDIVSMHFFERPQARFLVQELDSGVIVQGRNPQ